MLKRLIIILYIGLFSHHAYAHSSQDMKVALDFVEIMKPKTLLVNTAFSGIIVSKPYRIIVHKIGQGKASRLVRGELEDKAINYEYRWKHMLAETFLDHFSATQLASILQEKARSPHIKALKKESQTIDAKILKAGKPILNELTTEALKSAWSKKEF